MPSCLTWLREREEKMVELLRTLVNMDTPSSCKQLVDRAVTVMQEALTAREAQVERVSQADAGDHLVARWPGRSGVPRVLIVGHLDTVWPVGEAERRPFVEAAGKLMGPGVFDMKAGVVQALFAIEAFRSSGAADACKVTFLLTSDEETGSRTSRALIEAEAAMSDVVLIIEPASGRKVKTARKGVGMYTIRVDGRAAHAGLDPEQGRSAILELAHQIVHLNDLNDYDKGTTVTVGMISGGSARNVVPARAEATVDLRVVNNAEAKRLDAVIRSITPLSPDTTLTVMGGINRPPMERSRVTAALYERLAALAVDLGEELGETLVGGGSDGNFTAAMGVPTLDGLGAVGGGAHALSEHVERKGMVVRAALLACLLHDLGQHGVPQV